MKTKKAYSLALATVMASSRTVGRGAVLPSADPGTGAALKLSDSGTKEAGEGRPCGGDCSGVDDGEI
ncbi:MAG: hypothetical protein ACLTBV_27360 [Enterocloster bolteae]